MARAHQSLRTLAERAGFQLQRDASLTHFEFQVLTFLRWRQDSTAPMSEIADATTATLSRLSHVCSGCNSAVWSKKVSTRATDESLASPSPARGAAS